MIVIAEEIKNKQLRELILQEADIIIIFKDNNESWIAKNKFGRQRLLSNYEIPLFVKSYLDIKNP